MIAFEERLTRFNALKGVENFEALSIRELKALASGLVTGYGKLGRDELIQELIELQSLDAPKVQETSGLSIVERVQELYDRMKTAQPSADSMDDLRDIADDLLFEWLEAERGYSTATQVKTHYPKVSELLKRFAAVEKSLVKDEMTIVVNRFVSKYNTAISGLRKLENAKYQAQVAKKQADLVSIPVSQMIKDAQDVVASPSKHRWEDVSIAIALLTGRRMGEVHGSAVFVAEAPDRLSFKGQLKTKGSSTGAYSIPCLGEAEDIVKAHEYLRAMSQVLTEEQIEAEIARKSVNNGDRKTDVSPEEVLNSKFQKPLNRRIEKTLWAKFSEELQDAIVTAKSGGKKRQEKFSYKDLRDVYVSRASQVFKDETESYNSFIARVLGHNINDVGTANSYQKYIALME